MALATAQASRQEAFAMAQTAVQALNAQTKALEARTEQATKLITDITTSTKSADGTILEKDSGTLVKARTNIAHTLSTAFAIRTYADHALAQITDAAAVNRTAATALLESHDVRVLSLLDAHSAFLELSKRASAAVNELEGPDGMKAQLETALNACRVACKSLGKTLDEIDRMATTKSVTHSTLSSFSASLRSVAFTHSKLYEELRSWTNAAIVAKNSEEGSGSGGASSTDTPRTSSLEAVAKAAGVEEFERLVKLQASAEVNETSLPTFENEEVTYKSLAKAMQVVRTNCGDAAQKSPRTYGIALGTLLSLEAQLKAGGDKSLITKRFGNLVKLLTENLGQRHKLTESTKRAQEIMVQIAPLKLSEKATSTLATLGMDLSKQTKEAEQLIIKMKDIYAQIAGSEMAVETLKRQVDELIARLAPPKPAAGAPAAAEETKAAD